MNKGLKYFFDHDKIKDQIEKYSQMLINESRIEDFYKIEDHYYNIVPQDECIILHRFHFKKDIVNLNI